jgi:SAM-dependent methyltransferase
MPDAEELMAFYPEDSYYSYSVEFRERETVWKGVLRKLLFLEYKTKDPEFSKPGRMLDIGCGNGWFIYQMRNRGWEVKGIEPSRAGAETGRRVGLDIHPGDILSAKYPDSNFDYIRANHSFEHIPNPKEVLLEIHRILKPDGKAFIGVPNIASMNARLFGQYWYYLGAPVHTFNYSNKTLPDMLERCGFKNVSIKYNSNYNGILGSIQIYLNRHSAKKSHEGPLMKPIFLRILGGFIAAIQNAIGQGDCIEVIFEKK